MGVVLKQAQCVRESNGAVIGGVEENGKRRVQGSGKRANRQGGGVPATPLMMEKLGGSRILC